jgi:DNA-binding LacI/PurR family transcriptional regulator
MEGHHNMATMSDIAKAIGVSKTTVTNALAGKANVSEATRQRILQCAQDMGYRPNELARSLAQGKTFTIGLMLPSIANPFYPELAEAIENCARLSEYQTVLCNTHSNAILGRQQMQRLVSRWVDGCIIMERSMHIADIIQHFQQGFPIVLCDWQECVTPPEIPLVRGDFFQAGVLAARHLLELGHRRVAVIVDEPGQILRLQGFCSVFQNAGITISRTMIQQGHSTPESGYYAAKQLLAYPERPTAIFATTDLMAIGALEAVIDEGLHIPQDISVIGLDNILFSTLVRPALTSIAIPKEQLANMSMELLLSQIDGDQKAPITHLVEPYLVSRQSTAFPGTP